MHKIKAFLERRGLNKISLITISCFPSLVYSSRSSIFSLFKMIYILLIFVCAGVFIAARAFSHRGRRGLLIMVASLVAGDQV